MRRWAITASCAVALGACTLDRLGTLPGNGNVVVSSSSASAGGADPASASVSATVTSASSSSSSSSSSQVSSSTGVGGAGGAPSAGGMGGAGGAITGPLTWRSWETVIDGTGARVSAGGVEVDLEMFLSLSLVDLGVVSTFGNHHAGVHPEAFNRVQNYWAQTADANAYPYIGKSTVDRGIGAGESNAPAPMVGVRDLQVHPPNTSQQIVVAFVVPVGGDYTLADVAARRVDVNGGSAQLFVHAPCSSASALVSLTPTNDRAWQVDGQSHALGTLPAGQRICFAVWHVDEYFNDAVEVAWTVTWDG